MSKSDFQFALVVVAVILGVGGLFSFLTAVPTDSTIFYEDKNIVCHTKGVWGFGNDKTTCYKLENIKNE